MALAVRISSAEKVTSEDDVRSGGAGDERILISPPTTIEQRYVTNKGFI